eukprot:11166714-Lingulodinium_polyedra.AAC.1
MCGLSRPARVAREFLRAALARAGEPASKCAKIFLIQLRARAEPRVRCGRPRGPATVVRALGQRDRVRR